MGDFNDILAASEKKGRVERAQWLIHGFKEAIFESGLTDLHMEGYNYTWFKSLGTNKAVEEKLDRAMANNDWFNMFTATTLKCVTATASDHYPLKLECVPKLQFQRKKNQFRFENSWLVDPEFVPFV